MTHLTAISYGGGVQTVALAILAAQGKIARPDLIIFADTGRELAATYAYNARMVEWLKPFGLSITVGAPTRSLSATLEAGKPVIPMYGSEGGQLHRVCTERFKIRVVRRVLRHAGARTAVVSLGISLDEIIRMKDSDAQWVSNAYPLIDARLRRDDCVRIIRDAGLPTPPKSACDVCPHRSGGSWANLRRSDPDAFAYAVATERRFTGQFLHSSRVPLPQVADAHDAQGDVFDEDGCTGGYCFV